MKNSVLRLKESAEIMNGLKLPKGQELEVVQDVVYMNGYPLPPELQPIVFNWVVKNQNLFENDTRDW